MTDNSFDVLIDSDAFIAWLMPDDHFAQYASERFERLFNQQARLVTTSLVVTETATVLSNRSSQATAKSFLTKLKQSNLAVIHITEQLQEAGIELFFTQGKKGSSLVDCVNAVVMKQLHIPKVFSFDGFYKRVGLQVLN